MTEEELLQPETFRDRISTVDAKGRRHWIYALQPSGRFYRYRKLAAYMYLLAFFTIPFIKIKGTPLFMINVVDSKFILFGKIFWPQDFFILAVGMISFIIFIVLFTIIYGRLFCGWACPQTVFLEFIFRPLEWWIEGSPGKQKALHDGPWSFEKIWKKVVKHTIYLLFSFLIAHTFLAYILGADTVIRLLHEPISQHKSLIVGLVVFTMLFYGVFAFVREIVCTTICPYGRLQGVMFDKDTMQISYDYLRGEPRGKMKRQEARVLGDCIDCKKCVLVCPTGIDIRDGVQMDCVGCTACIDACDEVMEKIERPKGLIRYTSANQLDNRTKWRFTPRMKAYSVLLFILMVGMMSLILTRRPVDTYISRVKGQLYQEVSDDMISNLFDAKMINKTTLTRGVTLKLENMPGTIRWIGSSEQVLQAESMQEYTFFLDIPKSYLHQANNKIAIGVYEGTNKLQTVRTTFLGPFK